MDILSGALTVAGEELEWLPAHPMRKVRKPPETPGRVRFLTDAERQRLLSACQTSRNRALYPMVLLALSTGARKRELLTLRWEQVDLHHGSIHLSQTKNKTPRTLPLTGPALAFLAQYRRAQRWPESGWLFPRADGQRQLLIDAAWRAALCRAGITHCRFHDLRHSVASYLAMQGASTVEIAAILGHTQLKMVQRYVHLTPAHTAAVVARVTERLFGELVPGTPEPPPEETS